ncbi:carbohydrate ABC transporter permease [Xylanivirga thermophila]|uniref:carbohydrate ABC transporter permease n=1 Tax=Xylanivirga thermophila TaxID=2496273 RepID=UPI00101BDC2D|nr:carbohydrate ABC transporter permease [Xylanivirga thermophila]
MVKRQKKDIVFDVVNYVLLILIAFITIYPFYYILVISFNSGLDAARGGIYFWPRAFTLDNYRKIISDDKWVNAFGISVFRTVVGTALSVFFTSMVAYGLSYKKLLFRNGYYRILIFSMYFSGGLIPYYVLLRSLGLLNTVWVYIIPSLLSQFMVLIMISFFNEISPSLSESAHIDGANDLQIFLKIILPISKPVLATATLFAAVGHWNAWMDSAYYVSDSKLRTMSYLMMEIINRSQAANVGDMQQNFRSATNITTKSLQAAVIIISTVPILVTYPFLQKYFVKGIMLGSVKE